MSKQSTTDNKNVPLMLRLPPELHSKIKQLAAKNRRSLNSECVILLEAAIAYLVSEGMTSEYDVESKAE